MVTEAAIESSFFKPQTWCHASKPHSSILNVTPAKSTKQSHQVGDKCSNAWDSGGHQTRNALVCAPPSENDQWEWTPSTRKQEKRPFENRDVHNKLCVCGGGALLLRFTFIFTLGAWMFCLDAFVVLAEVRKGIGYSETEVIDGHELPCWWWEPNLLSTTDVTTPAPEVCF